ncbi:MAG: nitrate reductase [Actinomycetia bacterium]|nr:nitrate reductase [Actinomycetes bacterium]
MTAFETVAMGYRYPTASAAAELAATVEAEPRGEVARHMRSFIDEVAALPLGRWEELHTSTLDLSAPVAPYVGHVVWGENYRRGAFMADLQREMNIAGIELSGELPDHIEPVLRYLAAVTDPLPDLLDVLAGAVTDMHKTLQSAAPDNPYCHLLAATAACTAERPVTIGGRR